MYNDLYLQFETEEAAKAVLYTAIEVPKKVTIEYTQYLVQGELNEDDGTFGENYVTSEEPAAGAVVLDSWPMTSEVVSDDPEAVDIEFKPNYANIDTIGIIYEPTGEMLLGEDGEYPAMEPIAGWHVNVRLVEGENLESLVPYQVEPQTPMRVWG